MKALVLCAGKSRRITPISAGLPKPLIEIEGETILSRNLRWLAGKGVKNVWINLHYKGEKIRESIGDGAQFGLSISYLHEPDILGTAGAVKNLAAEWTETFLVICGDNLFNFDLKVFAAAHRSHRCLATVALFNRQKHIHSGIAGGQVALSGSYVQDFVEGGNEIISPLVNAGAYFLEPTITEYIPAEKEYDFGKELFPKLIQQQKKIATHLIDGYCIGIDTPASYHQLLQLLETKQLVLSEK